MLKETAAEKDSGQRQCHGIGHPNAGGADVAGEPQHVAQGQRHHDVADEGVAHQGAHVGYAAQGVGKVCLQPVAKLVEHEGDDEADHDAADFHVVGEEGADFMDECADEGG